MFYCLYPSMVTVLLCATPCTTCAMSRILTYPNLFYLSKNAVTCPLGRARDWTRPTTVWPVPGFSYLSITMNSEDMVHKFHLANCLAVQVVSVVDPHTLCHSRHRRLRTVKYAVSLRRCFSRIRKRPRIDEIGFHLQNDCSFGTPPSAITGPSN